MLLLAAHHMCPKAYLGLRTAAGLDGIVLQAYFSHLSQNTQAKTQEWAVIYLVGLWRNLLGLHTPLPMPGYVPDNKDTANRRQVRNISTSHGHDYHSDK